MNEKNEEFNESLRDIIVGHRKICDMLKWSGIEPTVENLDKHFQYRNIGCHGLICPNCKSIRLWVVRKKKADIFRRIDVTVFRCIDCDVESSFHYDSYNGCYEDPDRREAWIEDLEDERYIESNIPQGVK